MEILTGGNNIPTSESGIGAVVFDTPRQTPLDIELGIINDFDAYKQKKALLNQQKAKQVKDMLGGLKLNEDGVMAQHIPDIRKRANDIYNTAAKLQQHYQGDLSSPEAQREWLLLVEKPAQEFQSDVQLSKNVGEILKDAGGKYMEHPDKFDDESQGNIATLRGMPFNKIREMGSDLSVDKLLVPKKANLYDLVSKKVVGDNPAANMDVTTTQKYDSKSGAWATEKTKTFLPSTVQGMARAAYGAQPEITDRTNDAYSKLDNYQKQSYQQQAQAESGKAGRTVSPQEIFLRDYINQFNRTIQEDRAMQWSPQQAAYWQNYYKNKDEEEGVKYIAEGLGSLIRGDESIYDVDVTQTTTKTDIPIPFTGKNLEVQTPNKIAKYSSAFRNFDLGTVSIPQYALNDDSKSPEYGKPLKAADGSPIVANYDNLQNRIQNIGWGYDGKPYMQTTETIAMKEQGVGDGWEEITDRTIDKFVLTQKDPLKAGTQLRRQLTNMGSYPGQVVKLTDKTSQRPSTTQNAPATTKMIKVMLNGKTGEIPENQWAAFKKKYPQATR